MRAIEAGDVEERILLVQGGRKSELFNLEVRLAAEAAGLGAAGGCLKIIAPGVWQLYWNRRSASSVQEAWARLLSTGRPRGLLCHPLRVLLGPAESCTELLQEAQGAEPHSAGERLLSRMAFGRRAVTWWPSVVEHHWAKSETPPFMFSNEAPALLGSLGAMLGAAGVAPAATEAEADICTLLLRLKLRSHVGIAWMTRDGHADTADSGSASEAKTAWTLAVLEGQEQHSAHWSEGWHARPWTFTGSMDSQVGCAAARAAIYVHRKLRQLGGREGPLTILDPCIGSGTLAVAAALEPGVGRVFAFDIRSEFMHRARANLRYAGVPEGKVELLEPMDARSCALPDFVERTDIVLANPPWGKVLGRVADGTAIVRRLAARLPRATFAFFVNPGSLSDLEDLFDFHERAPMGYSSTFVIATVRATVM